MTQHGLTPRVREPMARPRRLAPRYPVQIRVRVRAADGSMHEYDVRDVSRGGLFALTDVCLPLFSEIDLWLPLPESGEVQLRARVVHAVSPSKARAAGVGAGMGLEFDALTSAQSQALTGAVERARADYVLRRRVRRRSANQQMSSELDPMLAYLLDAVDDQSDPEALAERLGLPLDMTEDMVHELLRLQLVELDAETTVPKPQPAAVEPEPEARGAAGALRKQGLPAGTSAKLAELWNNLSELDHYQILGVTAADSGENIRRRFFELGKTFHPDSYYGTQLGDDLRKLERVFARISEAYGVLSRERTRRDYDRYLSSKRALSGPIQPSIAEQVAARDARSGADAIPLPATREQAATMRPAQTLTAAEEARDTGQLRDAYRLLSSLRGLRIADRILERRISQLRKAIANALSTELSEQARYEERHQKWADAAQSWLGVCEGEPEDATPYCRAAIALIESRGDLQHALKLAKHAVARVPNDAETRRILARTYLAAGLRLNARHELELASQLSENRPVSRENGKAGRYGA